MNTTTKYLANCLWLILALSGVVVFGCQCSKPAPNPLASWKVLLSPDNDKLDKAITDDYRGYIEKLPNGEKESIGPIQFFENGTGGHAVRIEIALNRTDWAHILIYDKENKRIKVIKYAAGRYAC